MSLKSKLKRKVGKYKEGYINSSIYKAYEEGIDENVAYFESRDGNDFTGNIFRLVEELSTGKYGDYQIYVYAKEGVVPKIEKLQKNYDLDIYKIVTKESIATRILEKAKYIFTDSGIRPKFIKKPGQIMMNTWHGTPLKVMGIENVPEEHRLGSMQHTFYDSDYLLYPNDFMFEKMVQGYNIDRIYQGNVLLEGYPRNSVFFDSARQMEFKSKFNFEDKDVFVYMPTYRGTILNRKDSAQKDVIDEYLTQLDARLNDSQVFLVKLHVFNHSQIDFSKFNHIKPFPEGYEVYDIINMADILVTDYSSVFFDFAVSRRKIIIFNYDEDEYLSDRNIYFPISDLPFPKVQDVDGLVDELNSPVNYDDEEFYNIFCKYEKPEAVENICREVFKGMDVSIKKRIANDNPNVLVYIGSLEDENVWKSLLENLAGIDLDEYNVFLSFRQWNRNYRENHEEIFKSFPDGISVMPMRGAVNPTMNEKNDYDNIISDSWGGDYPSKLDKLFEREIRRYYHGLPFDKVINFDGTDRVELYMFKNFTTERILFTRENSIKPKLLKEIYSNYDLIVADSDDLKEFILNIVPDAEVVVKSNMKDLI